MAGYSGFSVLRLLFLILLAYGCYAAFMFFAQRLVIYPGRFLNTTPAEPPASAGVIPLWVESGRVKAEAWFLPSREKTGRRPAVLFFHGNGELIDFLPEQVEQFGESGMGVMLVEFPGYGRSPGTPSESSITAAAVAAYDLLAKRNDVDPQRIIAFGRSLGCGAACALSRRRPLAALILQAPFTSLRDFAPQFFLPKILVRDVFDNQQALTAYPGPVLILHGAHDDVIPVAHGRKLAAAARSARLVEMNCAHNDCPPDWREFWRIIRQFLQKSELS